MEQRSRLQKNILIFISMLFVVLIIVDRYYWAQIAQWREDQATNVWLGYTSGIGHMPAGLISSQSIPNPNGMVLLGALVSVLPNLLSISFFLDFIQILLILLTGWKTFGTNWYYFLLAVLPSLTSVILRSTSVEYWNQYVITLVNIIFILLAVRYLEKPSVWNLPPIVLLILSAPSLYLAGAVNAIVMTILTVGILLYKRSSRKQFWYVAIVILLIVLLSIFLTWLPYFKNVSLEQIAAINQKKLGPVGLFQSLWNSFFDIPSYVSFLWADKSSFSLAFKHADDRILSHTSQVLLQLVARVYLLQALFAFIVFSYFILRRLSNRLFRTKFRSTINSQALSLVTLSMLFISLSFAISAWLGGPDWIHGERPDQIVQFLPIFLFVIYLLPVTITSNGIAQTVVKGTSMFLLAVFVTVNLFSGFLIVRDHLEYRGKVLTEADVPLVNKMRVVEFIAKDWKAHSNSNVVSVDYDLGGNKWNWIPQFGMQLTRWYPATMTIGRSFDYELLRRYGLTNQQEGIQLRTFGSGRYLVTYAFNKPLQISARKVTNYVFGRLRVTVVEK